MLGIRKDQKSAFTPRSFNISLTWSNKDDAIVTYVEVGAAQNGNIGRAYISQGNIGEKELIIIVEAFDTYGLHVQIKYFGRKEN